MYNFGSSRLKEIVRRMLKQSDQESGGCAVCFEYYILLCVTPAVHVLSINISSNIRTPRSTMYDITTRFDTEKTSSGSHCNKGIQANLTF